MTLTFQTHFFPHGISPAFGDWAVRHRLYKRDDLFNSHFLAVYRRESPTPDGLLVVVAMDGPTPAGLTMLECSHRVIPAQTVVFRGMQATKIQRPGWMFHCMGRAGVYVAPKYRGRRLGTLLLQKLEAERLAQVGNLRFAPGDVLCLSAGEKAHTLAQKAWATCYVLEDPVGCFRQTAEISRLTRTITLSRDGYDVDINTIKQPWPAPNTNPLEEQHP